MTLRKKVGWLRKNGHLAKSSDKVFWTSKAMEFEYTVDIYAANDDRVEPQFRGYGSAVETVYRDVKDELFRKCNK